MRLISTLDGLKDALQTNEEMMFLYEGLYYPKEELAFNLNEVKLAPQYLKNTGVIGEEARKCKIIFNEILPKLQKFLNDYHNVNYELRYYKLNLGGWLFQYIHSFVNKYNHLSLLEKKEPELVYYAVKKKEWIYPMDLKAYSFFFHNDHYQLQEYTCIQDELNLRSKELSFDSTAGGEQIWSWGAQSIMMRLVNWGENVFYYLSHKLNKKSILVNSPGHKMAPLYFLALIKKFKVFPYSFMKRVKLNLQVDKKAREVSLGKKSNGVLGVLENNILKFMPIIYLEGLKELDEFVMKNWPQPVSHAYSSMGLLSNPLFCMYLARHHSCKLLYSQHGGAYGVSPLHAVEDFEIDIADLYFTWGWKKAEGKVVAFKTPLLKKKCSIKKKEIKKYIVLNSFSKHVYKFHFQPMPTHYIPSYYTQIKDLIENLNDIRDLLIRDYPHAKRYGWDVKDRLLREFKGIKFDEESKSFGERIENTRLCIFGHLTTVHIQTMLKGIPTVIVVSSDFTAFRSEAVSYFRELKEAKILFYSAVDAAEHINKIDDDVSLFEWWDSEKTQLAKNNFLNNFGRDCSIGQFYDDMIPYI